MIRMGSIVLWLGLIVTGLSGINLYTASPGQSDEAVLSWPTASQIEANKDTSQLLAFERPHFPCSRAAEREPERILALAPKDQTTFVVFSDLDANPSWHESELGNRAEQLASVHIDLDGQEVHRFGGQTSGHDLLFDGEGKCLFSGDETARRRHEGDGPSKLAWIDARLEIGIANSKGRTYAVIGCSLQRSEEER